MDKPPVVILCGGRGTRLRERTETIPKALVEIGGRPILWHVIGIYAAQGFRRFLLATGYLGEAVEEFVAGEAWPDGVEVECVDTGLDTPTGGRIAALRDRLGGGTFCATYADGVADVDLDALLGFHRGSRRLATMTVVRPHLQWGVARARRRPSRGLRREAAQRALDQRRLLLLRAGALAYLGETACWSASRWRGWRRRASCAAHRHEGFWDCMDTYKDAVVLNDLWAAGEAPWGRCPRLGPREPALVSGAHGFVGSHLARALLERGEEVRVLDRPAPRLADVGGERLSGLDLLGIRGEVELVEADLRDAEAVADAVAGADSVFHLAAQTIVGVARESPLETFEVNVRGRLERLRGLPRARSRRGSSSPPPTRPTGRAPSCPTARTSRCAPPTPTTPARRRPTRSPAATPAPTACRSRSPASPTSTAAATSTSPA